MSLFELKEEVRAFLAVERYYYAELFTDDEAVSNVLDMFVNLNELNRKMQDKNKNLLTSKDEIHGFLSDTGIVDTQHCKWFV